MGSDSEKPQGSGLHPEGCCARELVGVRRVKLLEGWYEHSLGLGPQQLHGEPENREKEPLSSRRQMEAGQRYRDPSSPVQAGPVRFRKKQNNLLSRVL